jgi:hypothetical protein
MGHGSNIRKGKGIMQAGSESIGEDTEGKQLEIGLGEVPEPNIEESHDEQTDVEGSDDETARETVERVIKEAEEKDQESKPSKEVKSSSKSGLNKGKQSENPVDLKPPSRFTAEEKEVFNQAPPAVKQALSKMIAQHEAHFTKGRQSQSAAEQEARHIVEAVRPYLVSNPDLARHGYTESRLVSELIGTHQKLTNKDTAVATWTQIGRQIGIDNDTLEALLEVGTGNKNSQNVDISSNPQFQAIQNELNSLKSYIGQEQSQKQSQTVQSIVSEMEAVRDEVDPTTNRYLYPELHDEGFIQRVKPLVSALVETSPELSYGEALRRATYSLRGDFSQAYQTKLPSQNNSNVNRKAAQAAVSVRGKVPPTSGNTVSTDIPKEAMGSARDSVRWALNQLRQQG